MRPRRKRALGKRAPRAIPQGPKQRWSLEFVWDALAEGRPFGILAVVDDFTRECLALIGDTSLPEPAGCARTRDHHCPARPAGRRCVFPTPSYVRN